MFFFSNATPTTEIYTLSLHDALPIWPGRGWPRRGGDGDAAAAPGTRRSRAAPRTARGARRARARAQDRKSTRLNSSHVEISYAVFCLKKKRKGSYRFDYNSDDEGRDV